MKVLAFGAVCLMFSPASADEASTRVTLQPGEAPQFALIRSKIEARAAQLREAWIASGHKPTNTAPSVISGTILTPSIVTTRAPAAPKYSVQFDASAGLADVLATFMSADAGQYLLSSFEIGFGVPAPTTGKITIETPFEGVVLDQARGGLGLYAAPGTWTLINLAITDKAGDTTIYNQSQIPALFPGGTTFTVKNPASPDTTVPLVTAGKILTPIVHLSSAPASFGARLTVSDDVSGVELPCVFIKPPGATTAFCDTHVLPAPVLSGNVQSWTTATSFGETGTGTITEYEVCDVAGNCLIDSNASDIQALFGTTSFTVAN